MDKVNLFVNDFFVKLEQEQIKYCIERNYEGYPDNITGDIDLISYNNDIEKIVWICKSICEDYSAKIYSNFSSSYVTYIGIYFTNEYPRRFALTIEIFHGATWKGMVYLSSSQILDNRIKYKNLWKPLPSHEASITLVHHILYNHRIFTKYQSRLTEISSLHSKEFLETLTGIFGEKHGYYIINKINISDWIALENRVLKFKLLFIFNIYIKNIIRQTNYILKSFISSRKKPPGLIVIVKCSNIVLCNIIIEEIHQIAVNWHIFIPTIRNVTFFKNEGDEIIFLRKIVSISREAIEKGGLQIIGIAENSILSKMEDYNPFIVKVDTEKEKIIHQCNTCPITSQSIPKNIRSAQLISYKIWDIIFKHITYKF